MALTPAGDAGATIAWQPSPEGNFVVPLRVAADDGTGVREVTHKARGFELSPDGSWIAYEALGGVQIRRTAAGAPRARLLRKGATIVATAWAPDGRTLALGAGRTVRTVDLRGRVRTSFRIGGRGAITGLTFSPDGTHVAVTLDGHVTGGGRGRVVTAARSGRGARHALTIPHESALTPVWGPGLIALVAGFIDEAEFAGNTTELHTYRVAPDLSGAPARLVPDAPPVRFTADGRLLLGGTYAAPGCIYDVPTATCVDAPGGLLDVGPDGTTRLLRVGDAYQLAVLPAGAAQATPLPVDDVIGSAQWRG